MISSSTAPPESRLLRLGLRLEYATMGWNIVEIGFLVVAAVMAQSVALAGFAFDSFIEIFASGVVIAQLKGTATEEGERRAVRLIGLAFLLLCVYIVAQAVVTLAADIRPETSPLGIGWLAATPIAMFALAFGKARTGKQLGNRVLLTESRVTVVDGALALAILAGLVLNAALGWWWADIVAGLVLVLYGLYEAQAALRG